MKPLFTAILFLLICSTITGQAEGRNRLLVNIISHSLENGAGKQVDVTIIKNELEKHGHEVNLCDYYIASDIPRADINIFLAQFIPKWVRKAPLNWFVPNPEFCEVEPKDLLLLDLILCKTKHAVEIFRQYTDKVYFMGFTSIDRNNPKEPKSFKEHLHVAGKSRMKGTLNVINAWSNHPELPRITVVQNIPSTSFQSRSNCKVINKRVSDETIIKLQNQCGIHLCPSKAEGFGHCIMEGMSVGSIVLTLDAPPMNEFIRDKRCLVKYTSYEPLNYAATYTVDEHDLVRKVQRLQKLSKEELNSISRHNRQEYIKRKAEFEEAFYTLIKEAERA